MKFPFLKEAASSIFSKPSTEQYPKVKKEAPEGYRGKLIFHPEKCINCGMCIRVCAPDAITRTVEKTPEGDDKVTLDFHMGSCTFCQTCADFCSKKCIEMSKDYAMVVQDESDLIVSGTFIKKKPAPKPKPAEGEAAVKPKAEKVAAEAKPQAKAEAAEKPAEAKPAAAEAAECDAE